MSFGEGATGYAAQYAAAINSGMSNEAAHAMANAATGGSGVTVSQLAHTVTGNTAYGGNFGLNTNGYVYNTGGPTPVNSAPAMVSNVSPPYVPVNSAPSPAPATTNVKAKGPEDLGGVLASLKPTNDSLGYIFLAAIGVFLLRMFGK